MANLPWKDPTQIEKSVEGSCRTKWSVTKHHGWLILTLVFSCCKCLIYSSFGTKRSEGDKCFFILPKWSKESQENKRPVILVSPAGSWVEFVLKNGTSGNEDKLCREGGNSDFPKGKSWLSSTRSVLALYMCTWTRWVLETWLIQSALISKRHSAEAVNEARLP